MVVPHHEVASNPNWFSADDGPACNLASEWPNAFCVLVLGLVMGIYSVTMYALSFAWWCIGFGAKPGTARLMRSNPNDSAVNQSLALGSAFVCFFLEQHVRTTWRLISVFKCYSPWRRNRLYLSCSMLLHWYSLLPMSWCVWRYRTSAIFRVQMI